MKQSTTPTRHSVTMAVIATTLLAAVSACSATRTTAPTAPTATSVASTETAPSPSATSVVATAPTSAAPSSGAPTTPATTQATPTTQATAVTQPVLTFAPLAAPVAAVGTVTHGTITVGALVRTYRLYIPTSLPAGPVPLFIGLHGGEGWADQFAQTNHIERLAESNGFIVVHPDGVKITGSNGEVWNGGACCGRAARENIDDVGFINALIDQLTATNEIDPHRIFAFGHSNGAIMSYRLACELSDRIVGIGLYAGTLGIDTCQPSQPVSIIHIHGAADQNIPLAGGVGPEGISKVDFAPPHSGFDTLAGADQCPTAVTSTSGAITTEMRAPCVSGSAAMFVTIAGANHAWAGGTPLRTPTVGAAYADYDATAQIVSFLLAHPRP